METLSSAEQAPRRSPGPGEFGCLLCPGGNSGCLAQSRPSLSQKLALMRAVGPVSFQDCALKQHEAESRPSFPGEMLRMHKAKASPPTPPPAGRTNPILWAIVPMFSSAPNGLPSHLPISHSSQTSSNAI